MGAAITWALKKLLKRALKKEAKWLLKKALSAVLAKAEKWAASKGRSVWRFVLKMAGLASGVIIDMMFGDMEFST